MSQTICVSAKRLPKSIAKSGDIGDSKAVARNELMSVQFMIRLRPHD